MYILFLCEVQTECSLTSDDDSDDESGSTRLSFATICKFTTYFREIIADHLMNIQADKKIGGVGKIVEIDESMFGKRQDNICLYNQLKVYKLLGKG